MIKDKTKRQVHRLNFSFPIQHHTQWHVKCYPGGATYAIQDLRKKKYMAIDTDGRDACGMEEDDAAILELEQSHDYHL